MPLTVTKELHIKTELPSNLLLDWRVPYHTLFSPKEEYFTLCHWMISQSVERFAMFLYSFLFLHWLFIYSTY